MKNRLFCKTQIKIKKLTMWDGWYDDYALKRILIMVIMVLMEDATVLADIVISAKFEKPNFSARWNIIL